MVKKKILIADDDNTVAGVISESLGHERYDYFCAYNGRETLKSARNNQPDLILLDIKMPYGNFAENQGIELCKELSADPQTRFIPVVFVTGNHDPDVLIQAFGAGGVDYIYKPFETAGKLRVISRLGFISEARRNQRSAFISGMSVISSEQQHILGNVLNSSLTDIEVACSNLHDLAKMFSSRIEQLLNKSRDETIALKPAGLKTFFDELHDRIALIRATGKNLNENISFIRASLSNNQNEGLFVEPVLIDPLLKDVWETLDIEKVGIDFGVKGQIPSVMTNQGYVRQIISPLFRNSIESLEEAQSTNPSVFVGLELINKTEIVISVKDNGVGSEEDTNKIFRNGKSTKGHLGFGLHKAACLANTIGGSIKFSSPGLGKGAVVTVTLPLDYKGNAQGSKQ